MTHEQALVEYNPMMVRPDDLLETLHDIGYQIWDPRKLRPFKEEAALVRKGKRLLTAIGIGVLTSNWSVLVPLVVGGSLLMTAFLLLRGFFTTLASVAGLGLLITAVLVANALELAKPVVPWVAGVFAAVVVFGIAQGSSAYFVASNEPMQPLFVEKEEKLFPFRCN